MLSPSLSAETRKKTGKLLFLTLTVDIGEWLSSRFGRFNPGEMSPVNSRQARHLEAKAKREIPTPTGNWIPVIHSVVSRFTDWSNGRIRFEILITIFQSSCEETRKRLDIVRTLSPTPVPCYHRPQSCVISHFISCDYSTLKDSCTCLQILWLRCSEFIFRSRNEFFDVEEFQYLSESGVGTFHRWRLGFI